MNWWAIAGLVAGLVVLEGGPARAALGRLPMVRRLGGSATSATSGRSKDMPAIPLQPVDRVRVTTLVDNATDVLLPDEGPVRRWGRGGSAGKPPILSSAITEDGKTVDSLRAEHGFSALVELHVDGNARRVLFDAGATPDGLIGNLDRLDLPPDSFEAIVFSHGHWDHVLGLDGVARRLGRSNMPVILHPDFWTRRRLTAPNGDFDLPTPSRAAIEGVGFTIVEDRRPSFLLDDRMLVTGEVERTTEFERGMPPAHQAWRDGGWQLDPLVHDDQAVVLHVRDKGLVVLTGCGHSGIVNIVRHARRLTGVDRVYAVLGGFHLRGGPIIDQTVAALAEAAPGVLVPAHCTSWRAHAALAAAFPGVYQPGGVGAQVDL
jgi:7,8-dihydropterin-6-yl-methyl-4-(beta-D-ribofuranosyl)aminobenzene 5'-phosphate synthase